MNAPASQTSDEIQQPIIWIHRDVTAACDNLTSQYPASLAQKIAWTTLQLATSGRTPRMKGTVGHDVSWRRTPIHANHYYLWWTPAGVRGTESLSSQVSRNSLFLRSVRHHDETSQPLPLGVLSDYAIADVTKLDPLYPDQREIAKVVPTDQGVEVRVVEGHPGSGKTVALQYTALSLASLLSG